MNERLINVKQMAKLLGVSKHRVYEMAKKGLLPVCRLGRQVRFDPVQIKEWLAQGGSPLPGGWKWKNDEQVGGTDDSSSC